MGTSSLTHFEISGWNLCILILCGDNGNGRISEVTVRRTRLVL